MIGTAPNLAKLAARPMNGPQMEPKARHQDRLPLGDRVQTELEWRAMPCLK
jgi:hypothetical protein